MNKNEELLIKDLTCRLSYGVKCLVEIDETEYDEFTGKDIGFKGKSIGELYLLAMNDNHVELYFNEKNNVSDELSNMSMEGLITINDIKPYLRPMSSITMEERRYKLSKFFKIINTNIEGVGYIPTLNTSSAIEYINWLNAKHFDYRGLIEMGLALEAPKDMYK